MERRYHALRIIAAIYRILGYIILVLTIFACLAICVLSVIGSNANTINSVTSRYGIGAGIVGGLFISIGALISGGIMAISLIGIAEGIYLLIAMEENTRKSAYLLENQNKLTVAPGSENAAGAVIQSP